MLRLNPSIIDSMDCASVISDGDSVTTFSTCAHACLHTWGSLRLADFSHLLPVCCPSVGKAKHRSSRVYNSTWQFSIKSIVEYSFVVPLPHCILLNWYDGVNDLQITVLTDR